MNKNILVTGANGFVGQHLCKNLLEKGYNVFGTIHEKQSLYFIEEKDITWCNVDISKPETLEKISKNIDVIYHLAAIPRNDLSKTWDNFKSVNIDGTNNLLNFAQKNKIKRFVYISTVEAAGYGDGINPRKEDDSPNPSNNYGKSKLAAEKLVLNNSWNFETSIIRLPMIYGPGSFLTVPKLFGMVKRGFYPLIGSGKNLMEFCFVKNAVKAISLAGEKKEAAKNIFYVSDERSYTIKEVITNIAKTMNKKVFFIHIPTSIAYLIAIIWEITAKILPFPPIISPVSKKPFFTRETVWWTTKNVNMVSTEKIQKTLGYKPDYTIEEGCKITYEWFKEKLWN